MCVNCMKIETHFSDGYDDVKFKHMVGNMHNQLEKEMSSMKDKKLDGMTGGFISIVNNVETLKGVKDIAFDFHFTIIGFEEDRKIALVLQDIDFFNPGCISDEVLDKISELKQTKNNFKSQLNG